jgi:hypothetical protein
LKNLQAAGKETCSLLADPLFVDPEKLDFRFKEGSPAIQLGIEGIDARGWGLTADFPYSEALAEFKKTRRPDSW